MATIPVNTIELIERFGPHLARSKGARLDSGVEPDKTVKTHCCFCGQQCGIELLVKHTEVIGFEPWMDFPFNQGKLCPKGVKRYLQGSHPDRLLHAYERDPSAPGGFKLPGALVLPLYGVRHTKRVRGFSVAELAIRATG